QRRAFEPQAIRLGENDLRRVLFYGLTIAGSDAGNLVAPHNVVESAIGHHKKSPGLVRIACMLHKRFIVLHEKVTSAMCRDDGEGIGAGMCAEIRVARDLPRAPDDLDRSAFE